MSVLGGMSLSIFFLFICLHFSDCCRHVSMAAIMTYQSRVQRHRKQRP